MAQIILKENVRKLGRVGEIVTVKDGYAFNFLIPSSKAIPATKENIAKLESQKESIIQEDLKYKQQAQVIASKLPSFLLIERKINENGTLYGAITAKDVAESLPFSINKHNIVLKSHNINAYGVYDVSIVLHYDVSVDIKISISDTTQNAQIQLEKYQSKLLKNTQENLPSPTQSND